MCGLAGVVSTSFSAWEYDIFERLLLINSLRGEHSTGVIRVQEDGVVKTRKSTLPSFQFVRSDVSDIIEESKHHKKPYALLGHTRHATKGATVLKNAHPFSFKSVVGMQNGTIQKKFKHSDEYETDTEAFYRNLNDYGLEKALEEIEAHDTAYVFQWIDKKEKTLNIIKNSKRPLTLTYAFGGTTLLWSSEQEHLEWVLKSKRYTTNTGWRGSTQDRFFSLHDNDLLSIPLHSKPMEKATLRKIEVKKASTPLIGFRGTTGTTSTTATSHRVSGDVKDLYLKGQFILLSNGAYKFIRQSSQDSQRTTNSSQSRKQTSTTKGVTSVPALGSGGTTNKGGLKGFREQDLSFRDRYGDSGLSSLQWLSKEDKKGVFGDLFDTNFEEANKSGNVIEFPKKSSGKSGFTDHQGQPISEERFRHSLNRGCFSCGVSYNLDNPHDFAGILNKHHWDEDTWACDECFRNSEGDWVRCTIEDDWGTKPDKNYVEG